MDGILSMENIQDYTAAIGQRLKDWIDGKVISDINTEEVMNTDKVLSARATIELVHKMTSESTPSNPIDGMHIHTWIGDINDITDPHPGLYLQKDSPRFDYDEQGFLVDVDGQRVVGCIDAINYFCVYDRFNDEVYMHDGNTFIIGSDGRKIVVSGDDPVFEQVKVIEDPTWTIYIYARVQDLDDGEATYSWVNIGSFDMILDHCWTKDPRSVAELKEAMDIPEYAPLTNEQIIGIVDRAFDSVGIN